MSRRANRHSLGLMLACLAAAGCSVPVASSLDDRSATEVVVALEQSGVAAEKERDPETEGAYRVLVARDDASTALAVLADDGLPERPAPGILEALGKGSVVPSRTAEEARLVAGRADELERSLRGLDGVLSARVHLGVPPHDPLALEEKSPPASASVLIRHRGPTPPLLPSDVQRLVAGAVPGLSAERVTVVMLPAPAHSRPPERELARVGPLTVARTSLFGLRAVIGVAALLNALLLACVAGLWLRLRRTERQLETAREPDASLRRA